MAKIKFENWTKPVNYIRNTAAFIIQGKCYPRQTTSILGKSKGLVDCPCCEYENEVYIWSFMGSGKRCKNCNVLLGWRGAIVKVEEITEGVKVSNSQIFYNK